MNKHRYLTYYSYDTGAVWTYVLAESENDIARLYPLLEIVKEKPRWLTPEREEKIPECDLDSPDEFLRELRTHYETGGT